MRARWPVASPNLRGARRGATYAVARSRARLLVAGSRRARPRAWMVPRRPHPRFERAERYGGVADAGLSCRPAPGSRRVARLGVGRAEAAGAARCARRHGEDPQLAGSDRRARRRRPADEQALAAADPEAERIRGERSAFAPRSRARRGIRACWPGAAPARWATHPAWGASRAYAISLLETGAPRSEERDALAAGLAERRGGAARGRAGEPRPARPPRRWQRRSACPPSWPIRSAIRACPTAPATPRCCASTLRPFAGRS